MLYVNEFYPKNHPSIGNKVNIMSDTVFSVILDNTVQKEHGYGLYSIINSVRPLARFSSIFGNQIVRYKNNDIHDLKLHNKVYSLCVIVGLFLSSIFMTPVSWKDTRSDIPLNVLTKSFGFLVIVEVTYLIFISTFSNGKQYHKLLKKLDDFDQHFMTSKMLFIKRRIVTIIFIIWTIVQMSLFFCFQPFHLHNSGVYFMVYSIILQGAIITFVLGNIYSRQLIINELLMNKISNNLPGNKNIIYKKSLRDGFIIKILSDSRILEQKLSSHYSWFELMQMYDKTADCVYLFNTIYAGQVFFMLLSGLVNTMLSICRYLSPTLKNSHVALSDVYVYSCMNAGPLCVVIMCEMLTKQKNKTLLMLLNMLVHGELDIFCSGLPVEYFHVPPLIPTYLHVIEYVLITHFHNDNEAENSDDEYYNQIQTMINLVDTRKMDLSAYVFTANSEIVLNLFARVVSYTFLMIQYFYMHVFSK